MGMAAFLAVWIGKVGGDGWWVMEEWFFFQLGIGWCLGSVVRYEVWEWDRGKRFEGLDT